MMMVCRKEMRATRYVRSAQPRLLMSRYQSVRDARERRAAVYVDAAMSTAMMRAQQQRHGPARC